MSLHYILDGYNITKQDPQKTLNSLQAERESLVRFIEISRPQGSANNAVTVVFDGQEGIVHLSAPSIVQVLFSQNESADELIKRLVQKSSHKKSLVVVTNDRELGYSVRSLGASVISVSEFLSKAKTVQPASGSSGNIPGGISEPKHLSKTLEHTITDEFKKIWLKKDSSQK